MTATPTVGFAPYRAPSHEPVPFGTFALALVLGWVCLCRMRASFRIVGRWMDRRWAR